MARTPEQIERKRKSYREAKRRARAANPEEARRKAREWSAANADKKRTYNRRQQAKRKGKPRSPEAKKKHRERMKRWRAAHPGAAAEVNRRWYVTKGAAYYNANRDRINVRVRMRMAIDRASYNAANRSSQRNQSLVLRRERNRRWARLNPQRRRDITQRSRNRMTAVEWQRVAEAAARLNQNKGPNE